MKTTYTKTLILSLFAVIIACGYGATVVSAQYNYDPNAAYYPYTSYIAPTYSYPNQYPAYYADYSYSYQYPAQYQYQYPVSYPQYNSNPQYNQYYQPYQPAYYPEYANNLSARCTSNVSSAYVGQYITWTTRATGGNGYYTYSWIGENIPTGTYASSVTVPYYNFGAKSPTVIVSSGNRQIQTRCAPVNIVDLPYSQPSNNGWWSW